MAKKETYYCVLPKGYDWRKMEVLMLAKKEILAKRMYEKWNDGIKLTPEHIQKAHLSVEKIEI